MGYVVDVVSRIASVGGESTKIHFLSDHVVGPAVRLVFLANILLWSFYLVFPWLSFFPSVHHVLWKCEHGSFAHYSFFFFGALSGHCAVPCRHRTDGLGVRPAIAGGCCGPHGPRHERTLPVQSLGDTVLPH